jgi:enoyl-CoA hydratase/carnithine racemase
MSDALVIHTRDERGVHALTLNQPQNFNALGADMIAAIQGVLDAVAQDDAARVLVIGAAGKAFCPGHNLKEMIATPTHEAYTTLFNQCTKMMMSLVKLPVPVIARVQGIATAAGCQLVAQCDLAVAVKEARFAVSGVNLGLFCSTPSVSLSRNVPTKAAMEMLITGEFISAEQALQWNLVNRVCETSELDATVEQLVANILKKPRVAMAMGKEMFYKQREMGMEAAYQLAGHTMACNMLDASALEGVTAFTEKRAPRW